MPIIKKKTLKEMILNTHEKENEQNYYKEALCFHENSKFGYQSSNQDFRHIDDIRFDYQNIIKMTEHYKEYSGVPQIPLPSINDLINKSSQYTFEEIILKRRSGRDFNNTIIPFLSYIKILLYSYGITGKMLYENGKELLLRATPSAGALYPLEIYSVVFLVERLEKGVYHYNIKRNCLELIKKGDFQDECFQICNSFDFIKKSSVLFLITGILERTLFKYRNRGLRFIYIDAGHLVENMYLTAANENISACSLGGLNDYESEKLLNIDGFYESLIYALVIGK